MSKLGPIFLCVALGVRLQAAQLPVTLGSTSTFAVLGGSTVTNSGPTSVNGNLGLSPGTSVTGFPPGSVTLPYTIHIADTTAGTAQNDLTTAYNDAATPNRDGGPVTTVSGDLGGMTLGPGLYNSATSLGITGTLTLNGTANSVFVFQMGSTLTTAVGSQVVLTGGAQAANVFWQVGSSATINAGSIFVGTILAQASISLGTGAALNGRALARTGAVTLLSNTIVQPGPPSTGGTPPALSVVCPNSAAQIGTAYNSLVVAMGGTPPYTYSITGSLPAGLTLNTSTGAVMGTPTTAGPDTFTANAADSAAGTASASCSITTAAAPPATPAPASLILLLIGLACVALYETREFWLSRSRS